MVFDGKIHAIDNGWAMIGHVFKRKIYSSHGGLFMKVCKMLSSKYNEYLIKNGKEKKGFIFFGKQHDEDYSLIFRPKLVSAGLTQKAQLILKFKRCENDGLTQQSHLI